MAGADAKWVDNLLSHFDIPGVDSARQGLARRISDDGVYHIALIRALSREIGVSTAAAVSLAVRILSANSGTVPVAPGIVFHVDRAAFQRRIDAAIAHAVESIAPARRGRPPRRSADG